MARRARKRIGATAAGRGGAQLPLSSRWRLIAAISSGGAIGDAAAMEAEGAD
jgi:hypothetical protein